MVNSIKYNVCLTTNPMVFQGISQVSGQRFTPSLQWEVFQIDGFQKDFVFSIKL